MNHPALFCPVLPITQQYWLRWKEVCGVIMVTSWADWRSEPVWMPWFYRRAGDFMNQNDWIF